MVVRIGILGGARIAPAALVAPARGNPEVEVVAVAARSTETAQRFADEHGIGRVLPDYAALVQDDGIDAVYVPLPASLHARWSIRALEAGKHVLCEKPFASNAAEAEQVAEVARRTGLVVMEAFHYRYHRLVLRMLEVLERGELGTVRSIDAFFRVHLGPTSDIRWDLDLGGGSMMDIGCYPLHLMRTLTGAEPEVVAAEALVRSPDVDRTLRAHLRFPGGVEGRLSSAMLARRPGGSGVTVVGSRGSMHATGFVGPQNGSRLVVRSRRGVHARSYTRGPTSYDAQLAAFAGAVLRGEPFPTDVNDAVANMRAIDACYTAAGLPRRPSS